MFWFTLHHNIRVVFYIIKIIYPSQRSLKSRHKLVSYELWLHLVWYFPLTQHWYFPLTQYWYSPWILPVVDFLPLIFLLLFQPLFFSLEIFPQLSIDILSGYSPLFPLSRRFSHPVLPHAMSRRHPPLLHGAGIGTVQQERRHHVLGQNMSTIQRWVLTYLSIRIQSITHTHLQSVSHSLTYLYTYSHFYSLIHALIH